MSVPLPRVIAGFANTLPFLGVAEAMANALPPTNVHNPLAQHSTRAHSLLKLVHLAVLVTRLPVYAYHISVHLFRIAPVAMFALLRRVPGVFVHTLLYHLVVSMFTTVLPLTHVCKPRVHHNTHVLTFL